MPYRDSPPDSGPLELCLECFHAPHEGVCPECGVPCAARRRRNLALGALRVLYVIVVLLFFVALCVVGLALFQEGVARATRGLGIRVVMLVGVVAVVLRGIQSARWGRDLDADARRRERRGAPRLK